MDFYTRLILIGLTVGFGLMLLWNARLLEKIWFQRRYIHELERILRVADYKKGKG